VIISQTPYRVSFAGGGTDLPAFYREEYGAVLSVAVLKHMYVTVSRRFEPTTRVSYTRTEIADGIDAIQHTIVREALRMTGLGSYLEITTIGDVPAGTGMGSSSALTVGLLNALRAYAGKVSSATQLGSSAWTTTSPFHRGRIDSATPGTSARTSRSSAPSGGSRGAA